MKFCIKKINSTELHGLGEECVQDQKTETNRKPFWLKGSCLVCVRLFCVCLLMLAAEVRIMDLRPS